MNTQITQEDWGEIRNSINIAAEEIRDCKENWFNEDYQVITKQKAKTILNTNIEEDKKAYAHVTREAKHIIRSAKS
ncbi:hypothetical protein Trydic_g5652 [Trypoxylus dichotomus]